MSTIGYWLDKITDQVLSIMRTMPPDRRPAFFQKLEEGRVEIYRLTVYEKKQELVKGIAVLEIAVCEDQLITEGTRLFLNTKVSLEEFYQRLLELENFPDILQALIQTTQAWAVCAVQAPPIDMALYIFGETEEARRAKALAFTHLAQLDFSFAMLLDHGIMLSRIGKRSWLPMTVQAG